MKEEWGTGEIGLGETFEQNLRQLSLSPFRFTSTLAHQALSVWPRRSNVPSSLGSFRTTMSPVLFLRLEDSCSDVTSLPCPGSYRTLRI